MDRLWTPWRLSYITGQPPPGSSDRPARKGVPDAFRDWPGPDQDCVFCNLLRSTAWAKSNGFPALQADQEAGILLLGPNCFVCLNRFPYSSGHLLILPYTHTSSLAALPAATAVEFIHLAQQAEQWLRAAYSPDGLNLGINMGEAAGAGVAGHLHLHALPRWVGDGSFMTTVGDTRILPETLDQTWKKLKEQVTLGTTAETVHPSTPV